MAARQGRQVLGTGGDDLGCVQGDHAAVLGHHPEGTARGGGDRATAGTDLAARAGRHQPVVARAIGATCDLHIGIVERQYTAVLGHGAAHVRGGARSWRQIDEGADRGNSAAVGRAQANLSRGGSADGGGAGDTAIEADGGALQCQRSRGGSGAKIDGDAVAGDRPQCAAGVHSDSVCRGDRQRRTRCHSAIGVVGDRRRWARGRRPGWRTHGAKQCNRERAPEAKRRRGVYTRGACQEGKGDDIGRVRALRHGGQLPVRNPPPYP
ncbi:hypothetical protein D3C76_73290 [compost metagenome]